MGTKKLMPELADNALCPCDSQRAFTACCQPLLSGQIAAPSPEALMRSRFSAFVLERRDYLLDTWHPSTRPQTLTFDVETRWLGLKIKSTEAGGAQDNQGWVTFAARYKIHGRGQRMVERSHFVRENGRWFYINGETL
jgi:SEC-C motif-containing protein